ncbi:fibritin protein [Proteus phage PM2]|uniref:Fibritin protein n=1 Tax=Proteus phage PM2 TaxID=2025809 RepID=A0A249XY45_9CAUD|nr:fibritin neck whisker [Proteus phage PM2]ASZ76406.1 fibritin protein [Proteus phage PM2]
MDKIELLPLPFVDGPIKDQTQIEWILNKKECLTGASKYGKSDGVLNRVPAQLYENIKTLHENDTLINGQVNELIDSVDTINESLEIGNNKDLIKTIIETKDRADIFESVIQSNSDDIFELDEDIKELKDEVGVHNPVDTVKRTLRDDTLWIKKEIGSYPGQDINGQTSQESLGSGMKRRIIDVATQTVDNTKRIGVLEKTWADSDVGSLTIEVGKLREELGKSSDQEYLSVYKRLSVIEDNVDKGSEVISDIMTKIGPGNVSETVSINTQEISKLNEEVLGTSGLKTRVSRIESKLGDETSPFTILYDISKNKEGLKDLNTIVGADTSSGLRGQVTWIQSQVGLGDEPPAPGTVLSKIDLLTNSTNELSIDVQNLQSEIGNNKTGIKGTVIQLVKAIEGTDPEGSTVKEIGIQKATEDMYEVYDKGMPLPPEDGKAYICRYKTWTPIPTSLGVFTAKYAKALEEGLNDVDISETLISKLCELTDGKVSVFDSGHYEIDFESLIPKEFKDRKIKFSIFKNDEMFFETSDLISTNNSNVFKESTIVEISENDQIHVKVESTDSDFSEISFGIKLQIKPLI